jgi:RimJ/RimL family protein N-acetyltransferase
MNEILRTGRLILRHFTPDDVDALQAILGHPEVMRFSLSGPMSREKVIIWLDKRVAASETDLPSQYAVISMESGKMLGLSGYVPYADPESDAEYEIGYRFHPSSWGRGIGSEAVQATLDFGFSSLGFKDIIAFVEKENVASVRILEKIGMQYIRDMLYHDIPVRKYLIKNSGRNQAK